MQYKHYNDYNDLLEILKNCGKDFDMELIDKAYRIALQSHGEQKRKSGIPYILHPVSVACILAEFGMDTNSIVAALLHDVVEDTDVDLAFVKSNFGEEIANLIDGVTKLGKVPFSSREEQQAENIRKMLIAMSEDIRVIIIKLADRLHNMRTIDCMPEQKKRDKARENMEVYAPIAHRLGIRAIKEELEDLSLKYLDPVAYREIEHHLDLRKSDRESFINLIKDRIYSRISDTIPDVYIEGRVKSINGIYRKVFMKGKLIDEIYDIYAIRVIVHTVNDCYNVLGIIHDIFRPLPKRFKDYISTPKPNLYQSLHTTVVSKEGIPFEVQIRTWDMHHTAEYGIAAHWKYKLGISSKNSLEDRLIWIRQMIENQVDNEDSTDLITNIKSDLIPEEVFVFTPRGDVIILPAGATVIDFAYAIHSEVGNRMAGAKINKRIVPIDYRVKTGEIVEILTVKESDRGPNRDWLKIVKTSEARTKIRQWFKKERREENIVEGKIELEKEFKRNSISPTESELKKILVNAVKRQHYSSIDDFYAAVGYGGIQLSRIISRIKDEYTRLTNTSEPISVETSTKLKNKTSGGVEIQGIENCLVRFSKCCNPLPGDSIIGFITRGYGVSIHKRNCINVPKNLFECDTPDRWIRVSWTRDLKENFETVLKITATDRPGFLMDLTTQISTMHLPVHSLNSRLNKDGNSTVYLNTTVNGKEHLESIISRLSKINGVISVFRG